MKNLKTFEEFVNESMEKFPTYNNGMDSNSYMKSLLKKLSSVKGLEVEYNYMDSTTAVHLQSKNDMDKLDLTLDIKKTLIGFDDNLDLDAITSTINTPDRRSKHQQDKGIISYTIPKKVDWWTLKRASGNKPSDETALTPEIVFSLLDRMASVSKTQHELADIQWTSLEQFLKAAEGHMNDKNYKKFYSEIKKKYPKMK